MDRTNVRDGDTEIGSEQCNKGDDDGDRVKREIKANRWSGKECDTKLLVALQAQIDGYLQSEGDEKGGRVKMTDAQQGSARKGEEETTI